MEFLGPWVACGVSGVLTGYGAVLFFLVLPTPLLSVAPGSE